LQVDLTEPDIELLREVIGAAVSDLSPEIADTDNPAYRRDLKARRERLQAVLRLLSSPTG
jgi:hypothetical protein